MDTRKTTLIAAFLAACLPLAGAQEALPEPVPGAFPAPLLEEPAAALETFAFLADDLSYLEPDPAALAVGAALAQAAESDASSVDAAAAEPVPPGLLNNEHYRESLRLKRLATEAFDYGDYDAAASYAADAARAAIRSDEYVALRLSMKAADDALAAARARLDWAVSVGADKTYAAAFRDASEAFADGVAKRDAGDYEGAAAAARRALASLADATELAPLPARYTVRPWAETKDCFWNIAAYPFVYGDPTKWPTLYQANKAKLRKPDNPDLLHVGIVLTIPSIRGEVREGAWTRGRAYVPLPPKRK